MLLVIRKGKPMTNILTFTRAPAPAPVYRDRLSEGLAILDSRFDALNDFEALDLLNSLPLEAGEHIAGLLGG